MEKGRFEGGEDHLPPTIASFALPAKPPPTSEHPPWMGTPPVGLPGIVPFLWEEAPGRPKEASTWRLPLPPGRRGLFPEPPPVLPDARSNLSRCFVIPCKKMIKRAKGGDLIGGGSHRYRMPSALGSFSPSSSSPSSASCSSGGDRRGEETYSGEYWMNPILKKSRSLTAMALHGGNWLWPARAAYRRIKLAVQNTTGPRGC